MKRFLFVLLLIFVSIPAAYAHPVITAASPAQSTTISAGTTQVVIHYSEAIEIDFSVVKVFDSNGNQIDNKDTQYYVDDTSLVVTTPPLKENIYTVTSKVLSKIDGHLVDEAFVFGVGNVNIPPPKQKGLSESIYFPEAGARFPGLVGQVIVLGASISSLVIWKATQRRTLIKEDLVELQKIYHTKFSAITGIALFLVFASNILMLVVQTMRLEASASNVLQTSFGSVWILRMAITVILLAVWFLIENKTGISSKKHGLILGLALLLIGTSTIIGHGTATEQLSAVVIDYVHNLVASVWIGGVIFFGFILLPALSKLDERKKEIVTLLAIPRFSSMATIAVGILIITGPLLLWILEDNFVSLSQSYYGFLIIVKIVVAAIMVGHGGYNQFRIQKSAETVNSIVVHKRLKKSLRSEAALGIILLGVVALLTNTSLPMDQIQQATAQTSDTFQTSVFSENVRFDVSIEPFKSGTNNFVISVFESSGKPIEDINNIKMKISNLKRNIVPIEIPLYKNPQNELLYEGKMTIGFSGEWNVEVEAQRTQHTNESTSFAIFVKPHTSELKTEITEFAFPNDAAPLYAAYEGDNIWISDTSKPRLWKFSVSEGSFTSYEFEGKTSVFLKIDDVGRIWFTDTPEGKIGYFDPRIEEFSIVTLPIKSIPISLETDLAGNIWVALVDQHMLLKYDPVYNHFEQYKIPTVPSGPVALSRDSEGNIWFAESQSGKIGVIDPQSGKIDEFMPEIPLKEPFALFVDDDAIWISEHVGLAITKFNPVLNTFESISVKDPNSLPFALTPDKFENIWIAQHTADKLGVYDPHKDEFWEVDIPTKSSFTQFLTSDKNGDIWFVEQRGNKLGSIKISEDPSLGPMPTQPTFVIGYAEIVAPLITAGMVGTSLFFVKSIHDSKRLESLTK
jgi:copper transport protein